MTDYANQLTGKEMEQGSINFTFGNEKPSLHSTLVIGVGGGGINVVSHMIESGVSGVEFAIIDTDKIMLDDAKISARLLIGQKETGGCGAGDSAFRRDADESVFHGVSRGTGSHQDGLPRFA